MKYIWFFLIPLFFLPNPGPASDTGFGTLEISDFVLLPFVFAIMLAPKNRLPSLYHLVRVHYIYFGFTALIGIFLIYISYDYTNPNQKVLFSLLKFAKLALTGYVGYNFSRLIVTENDENRLHWSILMSAFILSIGLIINFVVGTLFNFSVYKSANLASVSLAILVIYIGILYLSGYGSRFFRQMCGFVLFVAFVGITFSGGRGGMAATIVCFGIYIFGRKPSVKITFAIITGVIGAVGLYNYNPSFQREVDNTFFRDEAYLKKYKHGVGGVDDGGRLHTLENELPKLVNFPVFGSGFFHRGGKSTLWANGAHNFWVQILLETGILGFLLVINIFYRFYRHGKMISIIDPIKSKAFILAFWACIVGNLTGEYLYGGIGLLSFFLVYAPVGSTRVEAIRSERDKLLKEPVKPE